MLTGKNNGSVQGRRGLARRATAALLCSLVAGTGVVTTASPASAAVTEVTPPHDIGVFPMRDFLGVGGWGVGAEMHVNVIRDGVQIGSAGPMTLAADLELDGFAEVNHPGGVCWNGVTPNIVAGDRIEAVDAEGNGEFTVVQNVEVTQPATKVDADGDGTRDDIVARGMASNVAGTGRIDPGLVEQRVINPDLKDTAIGRRDVRAIFGAGGVADGVETRGQIRWDDATPGSTDPHWTATYLNLGESVADLVVAGQSRMLAWERTNGAGDRIGMTLWEYGELGGPGMGGCPASDNFAVGGATPRNINTLTRTQPNLTLSGTATDVDNVTVTVDDHNPATAAVTTTATVAKKASLDTAVQLPGATTWNASLPMAEVLKLDDDTLVASATYGLVKETTTDQDTDGDPATPAVPVKTRTSSPIGGANLNILKDLQVPAAPTAFPGSGRYTSAQSVAISPDNEIEDVVRYRVGATPTTTAEPTAASPVVPNQLPVTTTQTVKARSYDPAGNPSTVAVFEYTIAPLAAPGAPTGVSATGGNAQATVSWTAPADNGGSAITGYVVQTFQGAAFVRELAVPAGNTAAVVGQLSNGTAYNFKVIAVNAQGRSAASTASTAVTPAGPAATVPGAPTIGAPTAANASATVRWTAPASTGGSAITGYSVRVFNGATQVGAPRVVGNVLSTVVTGLTNGTAYTFDVAAINAVGTGTVSARSAAVTPRTEFVAPTVTTRAPAVGATAVAQTANVTATFSEPVTGVSGTSFTVRNAAGATVAGSTVAYDATTRVATFNPGGTTTANLAADSTYTVSLTNAVRDAAGNPLAPTTWTFVTGPRPTVTGRTPAVNATAVARTANVSVTFSENVTGWTAANVTMQRLDAAGAVVGTVTGTLTYNATTRVGSFNPFGTATTTLAASTRYRVNLGAGLRDAAGNPITATSWIFTTGA